jgi:CRISPR-associated exonuclease Cas4
VNEEQGYVAISALQHLAYCPRQFALIHVEQQWLEDGATAFGQVVHKRADSPGKHTKDGIRTERSVWLVSHHLRIRGIADMVEYSCDATTAPCPVEMKSGKAKRLVANKVQLCAQALCLEEAHGCSIEFGYLTYRKSRKRVKVEFTSELRQRTKGLIADAHNLVETGTTPRPEYVPDKCAKCSLEPICQPRAVASMSGQKHRDRMCES